MEYVAILVIAILILIWMDKRKRDKASHEIRIQEILSIVSVAQRSLDRMESLKTNTAKANACNKALGELQKLDLYPETPSVVRDIDEMRARLKAIIKVFPVVNHIEKAYKHKFKGNDKSEKNALLDALYEIRTNDVRDDEFMLAQVLPDGTGEIIQISNVENRLKELGWTA